MLLAILGAESRAAATVWLIVPEGPEAVEPSRRVAKGLTGISVVMLEEARRKIPATVEMASPPVANAMVASLDGAVRRFYYHADQKNAVRVIEEAVRDAIALLSRLRERAALWKTIRAAQLLLATVALQNHEETRARLLIDTVVARDPDWEPPAGDYAPIVRAAYSKERIRVLRERTGVIDVRGVSGGQVFVDGLPRGNAPLRAVVGGGAHEVQVLSGDKLSAPVRVEAGGSVHIDPACTSAEGPRCREYLRRFVGAEAALEIAVAEGRLRARVVGSPGLSREHTLEMPDALVERWLDRVGSFLAGGLAVPPAIGVVVIEGGEPGALVSLDGAKLGALPLRRRVPAGTYRLEVVSGDGRRGHSASALQVKAGETVRVQARLAAPMLGTIAEASARRRAWHARSRTWAWITTGLTVGLAATGLLLGRSAVSTADDLRDRYRRGTLGWEEYRRLSESADSKALAANVVFGLAGAGAVTAIVLFLRGRADESRPARAQGWEVLPEPGAVSVRVRY